MKYLTILTVALLAIVATSCCNRCKTTKSMKSEPLEESSWQLTQIEGREFIATDQSYTLSFVDQESISGKGECNRIMGSYKRNDDGTLTLSAATTRMMCPNQAEEDRFISILSKVTSYTVDNGMLMLFVDGELKMVLSPKK